MITMVPSLVFADQAESEKYTGVPYSKLDCQGFVEKVLEDCGVRKNDGSVYNWRGSNSMWRNALAWKGTISDCLHRYGEIPRGAWLFIVANDGGEKEKGYNDNAGNAKHVAIYCGTSPDPVRDSTRTNDRNGVGYRSIKSFTHVGLPFMIDYDTAPTSADSNVTKEEALKALDILKLYIIGGK